MKNHCSRLITLAALGALALGLGAGSPASAGNARSDRTEITYQRWLRQQAVLNAQWRLRFELLRERLPEIQQQGQENWARWMRMGRPMLPPLTSPAAETGAASPLPADPELPGSGSSSPADPPPPSEAGDAPAEPEGSPTPG